MLEAYGRGDPAIQIMKRFNVTQETLYGWLTGLNRLNVLRMYEAKYGPLTLRRERIAMK